MYILALHGMEIYSGSFAIIFCIMCEKPALVLHHINSITLLKWLLAEVIVTIHVVAIHIHIH